MIRKLLNATAALALLTGSIAPIQSHAYPDYDYYDYYDAGYYDDTAYDDDWGRGNFSVSEGRIG